MSAPDLRQARVEGVERPSAGLIEVTFATTDGPLPYSPGQWLSFRVDAAGGNGKGIWRVYSFCSSPKEADDPACPERFRVLVDIDEAGPGGACFAVLGTGDRITYHGPYGAFTLRPATPRRAVFVADGVGIGPVRGMLRTLFDTDDVPFPVTLIQEAGIPEELVYRDEFESLAAKTSRFTYVPTVPGTDLTWRGEKRDLNRLLPALHPEPAAEGTHWYLCGSGRYTDPLRSWLTERGVPRQALLVERFFD